MPKQRGLNKSKVAASSAAILAMILIGIAKYSGNRTQGPNSPNQKVDGTNNNARQQNFGQVTGIIQNAESGAQPISTMGNASPVQVVGGNNNETRQQNSTITSENAGKQKAHGTGTVQAQTVGSGSSFSAGGTNTVATQNNMQVGTNSGQIIGPGATGYNFNGPTPEDLKAAVTDGFSEGLIKAVRERKDKGGEAVAKALPLGRDYFGVPPDFSKILPPEKKVDDTLEIDWAGATVEKAPEGTLRFSFPSIVNADRSVNLVNAVFEIPSGKEVAYLDTPEKHTGFLYMKPANPASAGFVAAIGFAPLPDSNSNTSPPTSSNGSTAGQTPPTGGQNTGSGTPAPQSSGGGSTAATIPKVGGGNTGGGSISVPQTGGGGVTGGTKNGQDDLPAVKPR